MSLCLLCHSSFAFILKRKRKLVALLILSYKCIITINGLFLFLTVSCVGVQCVIVVFPDHTHLLFERMDIEIIPLSNFATMFRIGFDLVWLTSSAASLSN